MYILDILISVWCYMSGDWYHNAESVCFHFVVTIPETDVESAGWETKQNYSFVKNLILKTTMGEAGHLICSSYCLHFSWGKQKFLIVCQIWSACFCCMVLGRGQNCNFSYCRLFVLNTLLGFTCCLESEELCIFVVVTSLVVGVAVFTICK